MQNLAIAIGISILAKKALDYVLEPYQEEGKKTKKGKKAKKAKKSPIDLGAVAAGVAVASVPAVGGGGFLAKIGGAFRGAMGGWMGFAFKAAGISALIGTAVAVFNRFTERWSGMGLPLVMPITSQVEAARTPRPYGTYGHPAYGTGHAARQDNVRTASLGEYVG